MISLACPGCGAGLKVKDELAGKRGQCPRCKKQIVVPLESAPAEKLREAVTILPASKPGLGDRPRSSVGAGSPASKSATDPVISSGGDASDPSLTDFLTPAQAKDELGRLGPYRILKILGAGGMGVVFQAEDPQLQRLVAIKAMLPALAASGAARQRFLREARAAAAIEHDNIITVLQVGEDRGVPFLAMPFLKGESLEERLARQKILPLEEGLRIGRETAEGLAAAHERSLIHRDIKPANLWLEGELGRVKILDFGLARGAASDQEGLTAAGAVAGTPGYMAPEQVEGQTVDARTDLFSLGVVLYRMLTGVSPYPGKTMLQFITSLVSEKPPAPRQVQPEVPAALSDLVMQLLSKKPEDRVASARQVAAALAAIKTVPPLQRPNNAEHSDRDVVVLVEAAEADEETLGQRMPGENRTAPAKRKRSTKNDRGLVLGGILVAAAAVISLTLVLGVRAYLGRQPANGDTVAQSSSASSTPAHGDAAMASLLAKLRKNVQAGRLARTQKTGGGGVAYEEIPGDGALLVGFEVSYGKFGTNSTIKTLRPIFFGQQGRVTGTIHGGASAEVHRIEAKPGYAVGAVTIKSALMLDGMSVTFMEVRPDGLNSNRSYESDWIGGPGGWNKTTIGGGAAPVVGIFGNTSGGPTGSTNSLGLVTALVGE